MHNEINQLQEDILEIIKYLDLSQHKSTTGYGTTYTCKCCGYYLNCYPHKHKKDCNIINILAKYSDFYKQKLEDAHNEML